jgi:hypothetical protein
MANSGELSPAEDHLCRSVRIEINLEWLPPANKIYSRDVKIGNKGIVAFMPAEALPIDPNLRKYWVCCVFVDSNSSTRGRPYKNVLMQIASQPSDRSSDDENAATDTAVYDAPARDATGGRRSKTAVCESDASKRRDLQTVAPDDVHDMSDCTPDAELPPPPGAENATRNMFDKDALRTELFEVTARVSGAEVIQVQAPSADPATAARAQYAFRDREYYIERFLGAGATMRPWIVSMTGVDSTDDPFNMNPAGSS